MLAGWIVLALLGTWPVDAEPAFFPRQTAESWSLLLGEDGPLLRRSRLEGAAAWGSFTDAINETGWAILDLHSSEAFDGEKQSYAVGYLEGWLTASRIAQHLNNMWGIDFAGFSKGVAPTAVRSFVEQNLHWMRAEAKAQVKDPAWYLVGCLLEQLKGLSDGYNAASQPGKKNLTEIDMLMLTMVDTDMDSVVSAVFMKGKNVNRHFVHPSSSSSDEQIEDFFFFSAAPFRNRRHQGHCTALVQCAPDLSDLWVTHGTWDSYRAMLRMAKYLDMPLPGAAARRMAFTANPSNLYSADDFYTLDTGLTVLETSITNYNKSLWLNVKPESLMTWARTMVANRLATSGSEWTELQLKHSSGTCNNQWMVVDYKLFSPGMELADGTLWVSETMPGHAKRADMTDILRKERSWPSYNIPYFEEIWAIGGYAEMQQQSPSQESLYSYKDAPRAQMFAKAKAHGELTSLSSVMHFMRRYEPKNPLTRKDSCNGIAARCDLNPTWRPEYDCFGAVDTKITKWRQNRDDLSFFAVASPAFEGAAPFSWHLQNPSVDGCAPEQHLGHPDTFNFSWYAMPSRWHQATEVLASEGRAFFAGGAFFAAGAFSAAVLALATFWASRRAAESQHLEYQALACD